MQADKNDLILAGLESAFEILEKVDELADMVCKIASEGHEKVDEYVPRLLAQRIAERRAKQTD